MSTTTEEELDGRYIILKEGYTKGKLIRQPDGTFHCPHIGCDYISKVQTGMGMHRKMKHGHKTIHSDRYKRQWQQAKEQQQQPRPHRAAPVRNDVSNILTGEILMLRRMQVLAELADFILSTRRTGNNGAIL